MWRWTTLVFLVVLHKYSLSQPITGDIKNDRPTRQLDFRECCPCEDIGDSNIHHESSFEDPMGAGSEGVVSLPREVVDCPCLRDSDSHGASSLFFPTAVRAAGSFLRAGEKNKEELKPLFNPEVDLASSVLQTLREVTDEEYKDALARDAAKSAMRAVEDIMFEDATPQESANLLTFVVPNPNMEDDDDIIPEASHSKQSRCIHPLKSARSHLGVTRMASKPSLISYRPRISKTKPRLLHKSLYDMDSGVGASNIHEHIVPVGENNVQMISNPSSGLSRTNFRSASSNNNENYNFKKVPDSGTVSVQNKLSDFDLNKSPLLQSIRDKLRIRKLLPDIHNDDLSPAPSIIHEKAAKKVTYLEKNSPIESFTHDSRPLSLPNLLNLKDVEFIPLKDLISKQRETSNFNDPKIHPSIFSNDDAVISPEQEAENSQSIIFNRNNPVKSNIRDTEGSSSLVNEQVSSDDNQVTVPDCNIEKELEEQNIKDTEKKISSTEILDTMPDSTKNLPTEIQSNPEENLLSDDTNCIDVANNYQDSMTDASNTISKIIENVETKSSENETESSEKSNLDTESTEKLKVLENKPKLKLLDPVSVEKTLSTIKENIAKKLDDLKNIKTTLKNKNIPNRNTIDDDDVVKQDIPVTGNENEDCQREASMQDMKSESDVLSDNSVFVTTAIPNLSNDVLEDNVTTLPDELSDEDEDAQKSSPTKISLQDLQELSDSILQQEERASKINEPSNEHENNLIAEESSENYGRDAVWLDSHNSANTQTEIVVDPQDTDTFQGKSNNEDTCKTVLSIPKTLQESQIDTNSGASEIVTNSVPKSSNFLESQPILQPTLNVLKTPLPDISDVLKLPPLDPLPTLDNLKNKLTSLFDKNERDVEDVTPSETEPMCNTFDILDPVMASDASTTNFQLKAPPSKFLGDSNLDILGLRPRTSILSNIPKIDLKPKVLSLQPIKLQSALEDKQSLFQNSGKSNFRDSQKESQILYNPLNIRPKLIDVRDRLDSPIQATNNIHTTLKNTQNAIESGIRHITNNNKLKSPIIGSPSLLDSLSINHDDVNDKLRALHVDFNDRIETMRNELFDRSKLLTSGFRNTKPNFRPPSNNNKQNKLKQASSRGKSQKTLASRKSVQQKPLKINLPPKSVEQKKFRMQSASSVPVPKTVKLPELKATPAKSPPFKIQKESNLIPKLSKPLTKEISVDTGRQASILPNSNKIRNNLLPKKERNIKVSFSTTPRPAMSTVNNLRSSLTQNSGKRRLYNDHSGSPSEVKLLKTPAPVDHLNKHNKYENLEMDDELPRRGSAAIENDNLGASDMMENKGKSALQSWPRASESAFLSKLKEAVQTRLSKVKTPKMLKQSSIEVDKDKEVKLMSDSKYDMARSATENKEILDRPPLKENVSYKCKMFCTKE